MLSRTTSVFLGLCPELWHYTFNILAAEETLQQHYISITNLELTKKKEKKQPQNYLKKWKWKESISQGKNKKKKTYYYGLSNVTFHYWLKWFYHDISFIRFHFSLHTNPEYLSSLHESFLLIKQCISSLSFKARLYYVEGSTPSLNSLLLTLDLTTITFYLIIMDAIKYLYLTRWSQWFILFKQSCDHFQLAGNKDILLKSRSTCYHSVLILFLVRTFKTFPIYD